MRCKICNGSDIKVIYNNNIRDGAPGTLTDKIYKIYQCENGGVIWHDIDEIKNLDFYGSKEYREKLENDFSIENYYKTHDKEVLEKIIYTGTDIFRDATVADIGCGGGSFLDFISGVAKKHYCY